MARPKEPIERHFPTNLNLASPPFLVVCLPNRNALKQPVPEGLRFHLLSNLFDKYHNHRWNTRPCSAVSERAASRWWCRVRTWNAMLAQFFPYPFSIDPRLLDSIRLLCLWVLLDFRPRDGRYVPIGNGYRVREMRKRRTLTCRSSRRKLEAVLGNRIELCHRGRMATPEEPSSNLKDGRRANI